MSVDMLALEADRGLWISGWTSNVDRKRGDDQVVGALVGVAVTEPILLTAETARSRPYELGDSLVKGGGAETRYGETWLAGSVVEAEVEGVALLWPYGSTAAAAEVEEKGTRGDMALLPFTMRIADARSESLRRLCIWSNQEKQWVKMWKRGTIIQKK